MAALVSPQKEHLQHPLLELCKAWNASSKKEKEEFDLEPWKREFECFLDVLCNSGPCVDMHNRSRTINCNCMAQLDFANQEEQESIFNYLFQYARLSWSEQRVLVLEWKRYAAAFCSSFVGNRHRVYLLPGSSTYKICKRALAKLIGKERHAWQSIEEGKEAHGLTKRTVNHAQDSDTTEKLHNYFKRLQSLGAPRATRLVTSLANGVVTTELKDSDVELIKLPACQS
jgi:hypothetical protein